MKYFGAWAVFLISGFLTSIAESPPQTTPTYDFIVGDPPTEYALLTNIAVTASEATSLCASRGRTGQLARLKNKLEVKAILGALLNLKKIYRLQGEIWIKGWVPANKDPLNYEDINGPVMETCVVLSDWNSTTQEHQFFYGLVQKDCGDDSNMVLCRISPIYNFDYLIAQGIGRCPESAKAAINGSIYMTASNCTSIGGKTDGLSRGDSLAICFLDWCAVSSAVGGWAFSVNGLCASKRYFTAGIKIDQLWCDRARGKYEQYCWLQLCFLGDTTPTRDTFALVGPNSCTTKNSHVYLPISVRTEECIRASGNIEYNGPQQLYRKGKMVECTFKTCRLGKDCKTTQHGKEYRGSLDFTISGKRCQNWTSQVPHRHANTNPDWFPDATLGDAKNYCRNPGDWVEGPYCYTTDPKVTWEICDLPFCEGSGPDIMSFDIGQTTYMVIPGLHNDPSKYCRSRFGAALAFIEDRNEIEMISEHLMRLVTNGEITDLVEIWVAGKTQLHPDVRVEDFNLIVNEAWPMNCLLLSRWNASALMYNNHHFELYSSKCQLYMRNFLCELVEVKIPNYQIYGGSRQYNISDEFSCKLSCVPPCTGVDFDLKTNRCYFIFGEDVCRTGRQNNQINHYRKKNCECNRYLVTGSDGVADDKITASSVFNGTSWLEIHSPSRARMSSEAIATPDGVLANAWVADVNDIATPWIQAEFPALREVIGVVIAGRSGRGVWVSQFSVKYSEDCKIFSTLKKSGGTAILGGNKNDEDIVTVDFPQIFRARCVRIYPRAWNKMIAMKFDLIGCVSSRLNLALGKPAQQDSVMNGHSADRAVDGYNIGFFAWNYCIHTRPGSTDVWWMVNLEDTYRVTEVLITNREDCCRDRLAGVQIFVTKAFSKSSLKQLESDSRCGIVSVVPMAFRQEIPVVCEDGIIGRHVVIVPGRGKILSFCEVKVYGEKVEITNFAMGKSTFQSSTENDLGYASKAVDGNHDTVYHNGFCSHTASENKPWWAVDLGIEVKVESVVITNRGDCCGERLNHFTILVGDTLQHVASQRKCAFIEQSLDNGETRHIICDKPISGRIVKIQLDYAGLLTLCEVEVYGERAEISTFGGTARGAPCIFPFIDEKGQAHERCIFGSRHHDWCGTSNNNTSEWGYCQDVRVRGGRYGGEGRVEVRRNVTWGGVCDDGWNDLNSKVTCSQLGYEDGRAIFPPFFPTGSGEVFISEVMCRGNETALADCDYMDGTWHACSTHEDAGVQCYNAQDVTFFHGAPAVTRRYTDEWWSGVILLPSPDIIPFHGRIIAWQVYAVAPVAPSDILTLQVWRFLGDDNFVLIGSNDITVPSKGFTHMEVLLEDQVNVMPGDVLGIKFLQNNPVPFDYSFSCVDDTVYYFQNISDLYPGDVVRFQSKTMRNRCKLYSVSAKLERDEAGFLPDFSRGSSVYLILAEQHIPLVDAEVQCILNLGINGTVLRISSAKEYREVNRELLERALFGEFWLENSRSDVINMTDSDWLEWAHCDPDPGKNCLALSRDSNLEQNFRWKTTTCETAHFVICERNDGIEGDDEEFQLIPTYYDYYDNATEPSGHTEKQKMANKKTASTAVVLTIIFLVLVAMAVVSVFIIKRYRRHRPVYSSLVRPTYKSEGDAVDLGNNQFDNPMYDVNMETKDTSVETNTGISE